MAPVLAVMWTWKVALGVLGVAALVWFLLAAFVASRWPALHPALSKLRTPPARMALVGVLVALALGAALFSRSADARGRTSTFEELARHRRVDRRLVLHAQGRGMPHLTMVHVTGPCAKVHVEAEADDADADAQEAYAEAEEQAREAEQEAREREMEAREQARERAQEARERARERAQQARERAEEIAEREMERAQAVMERMSDEVESTRDAVQEGFDLDDDSGDGDRHERSKMESFLERQAEKVERLGHQVADQLRGLASRFGDEDQDQDRDEDLDEDSADL